LHIFPSPQIDTTHALPSASQTLAAPSVAHFFSPGVHGFTGEHLPFLQVSSVPHGIVTQPPSGAQIRCARSPRHSAAPPSQATWPASAAVDVAVDADGQLKFSVS